jgi:hypothetical protein
MIVATGPSEFIASSTTAKTVGYDSRVCTDVKSSISFITLYVNGPNGPSPNDNTLKTN